MKLTFYFYFGDLNKEEMDAMEQKNHSKTITAYSSYKIK